MLDRWQEPEVPGKKLIILNLVEGAHRVQQESAEVTVAPPSGAFCDVRGYRNRRTEDLALQRPGTRPVQVRGCFVHRQRQFVRLLPHLEFSVVLHSVSPLVVRVSARTDAVRADRHREWLGRSAKLEAGSW